MHRVVLAVDSDVDAEFGDFAAGHLDDRVHRVACVVVGCRAVGNHMVVGGFVDGQFHIGRTVAELHQGPAILVHHHLCTVVDQPGQPIDVRFSPGVIARAVPRSVLRFGQQDFCIGGHPVESLKALVVACDHPDCHCGMAVHSGQPGIVDQVFAACKNLAGVNQVYLLHLARPERHHLLARVECPRAIYIVGHKNGLAIGRAAFYKPGFGSGFPLPGAVHVEPEEIEVGDVRIVVVLDVFLVSQVVSFPP